MTTLRLFAPLKRHPAFPKTSMDLRIGDVRYDLIIPPDISNLMVRHFVGPESTYRRVERYSHFMEIEALRGNPGLLDEASRGVPTYAHCINGVEDSDDFSLVGYVAARLIVGPHATRVFYGRAARRNRIDRTLADYVIDHEGYFHPCVGFEILHMRYYFDDAERVDALRDVEEWEPTELLAS